MSALIVMLGTAALGGVSYLGWNWLDGLVCRRIAVHGHVHAERAELLEIARVDTGVRLLEVDPKLIADRLRRHPWVRSADVRRLPPETVSIEIEERRPVALALGESGRLAAYLDGEGYPMPVTPDAVYDVPLLRGLRLPKNRTQRIETASVLELLEALKAAPPFVDALASTFEMDETGDVTLYTTPAAKQESIPVRLGREAFAEKFARLQAFWHQAVLTRPEKDFTLIDLRFDSQIVTQES